MKTKYVCLIVAFCLVLGGCSKKATAAVTPNAALEQTNAPAQSESDFEIVATDGKVTITGYTGSAKDVVIPPSINELPVTAIGREAFKSTKLTSVSLPSSVRYIGESAFKDNQLTSVNIPDSVTSIGETAFEDNTLTRVSIGANVSLIEAYRFGAGFLQMLSFDDGFAEYYNSTGKHAGTYVLRDGEWSREE